MLDIRFMFGAVIAGITVIAVMLVVASWMLGTGDASVAILGERPSLETAAAPRIEQEPTRRVEAGPAQSIDPKAGLKSSEPAAIPPAMPEIMSVDVTPAGPAASEPPTGAMAPPEAIKAPEIKATEPKKTESKIAESMPMESRPLAPEQIESKSADTTDEPADETKAAAAKPAASKAAKQRRPEPVTAGARPAQPNPADPSVGTGRVADQGPPAPDITGSIDPKPKPQAAKPRVRRAAAAPKQPEVVNPFVQFFRDLEQLQQPQQQQQQRR